MENRSVSVRAIVIFQSSLLVEWRADAGVCFPPGGRIHHSESLEEGLARELNEELGILEPVVGQYLGTIFSRWRESGEIHEVNNHFFEVPWPNSDSHIPRAETGREFRWIGINTSEFEWIVPRPLQRLVPALHSKGDQLAWHEVEDDT